MRKLSTTDKIEALMADGCERHRAQIEREAELTSAPQTTLRRLRDLRDRGYLLKKREDKEIAGLFWYRAIPNKNGQQDLFETNTIGRAACPTKKERSRAWRVIMRNMDDLLPHERLELKPVLDWLHDTGKH